MYLLKVFLSKSIKDLPTKKGYLHANTTENDLFLDPKYNKQPKSALHYKRKKRRIKSTGHGTGDIIVGGW